MKIKPNAKKAHSNALVNRAGAEEDRLVTKLSVLNICKKEVSDLLALVNKKGFSSDYSLQKEAALLYRGIHQRVMVMNAHAELQDHKDIVKCLQILASLRLEYSQIFNRVPVDISMEGPLTVVVRKFAEDE